MCFLAEEKNISLISYLDCKNDKTSNIQIELIDDSPFHLKGTFPGPEGTPYEGGKFDVVSG
jgi:ubiquitin-protein ligase